MMTFQKPRLLIAVAWDHLRLRKGCELGAKVRARLDISQIAYWVTGNENAF